MIAAIVAAAGVIAWVLAFRRGRVDRADVGRGLVHGLVVAGVMLAIVTVLAAVFITGREFLGGRVELGPAIGLGPVWRDRPDPPAKDADPRERG